MPLSSKSSQGSQPNAESHHVPDGTQRPPLQPGCAQHPASQLAAHSVKELTQTLECFSAQIQLRAYTKCEPLGCQGGEVRGQMPLQGRKRKGRTEKKKTNLKKKIQNENVSVP